MLQIRNVTKIYHSKSGKSVKALDDLSVTFPERGMVFVLGKSGSGKSTLLNVIGGLDGYDEGEFIIKGKSSKSFAGSDFDAYRNTFIGFIFQEYNVLDDFTVGANIGLALELQGKKATNDKINGILAQVDMLDYAKRKPNELSGGQKQRVAIARALVKDPEIIMADEPTGALDSNTGKQIFDTLKELSKTKLVIVVSHDRDFAERYGDRIIEMQDGKILSDVTKREVAASALSDGILKMSDNLLRIERGYQLTARDMELINEYLRSQSSDIIISGDRRINDNVRSAAGISQNNTTSVFNDTDESKDVETKEYNGKETKFIRSRLPFKNALKMGSSSLGHKKFRLVMTIFLSMIAFALFGFADTLGAYDKIVAATDSIVDSNVQNASFTLGVKHTWTYADGDSHSYYNQANMNKDDIKSLSEKTGLDFVPVFSGGSYYGGSNISLTSSMISTDKISQGSAYTGSLYGFVDLDRSELDKLGLSIVGEMPKAADEIAISELIYRQFNMTGFKNNAHDENVKAGSLTMDKDGGANSIIGKHLTFDLYGMQRTYKITAVIDTNFDYNRYAKYVPSDAEEQQGPQTQESSLIDMIMLAELGNTLKYGFHGLGYVTEEAIRSMSANMVFLGNDSYLGTQMNWQAGLYAEGNSDKGEGNMALTHLSRVGQSKDLAAVGNITWLDGKSRTELGENEMVISNSVISNIRLSKDIRSKVISDMKELFGSDWLDEYNNDIVNGIYSITYKKNNNSDNINAELCAAYRSALEKITGRTYDSSLPISFYQNIFYSALNVGSEEMIFTSDYSAKMLAIYEYAYGEVYSGRVNYKDEAVYDLILADRYSDSSYWESLPDNDKKRETAEAYAQYIMNQTYDKVTNELGGKVYADFAKDANDIFAAVTGLSFTDYLDSIYLVITEWGINGENKKEYRNYKIVGTFDSSSMNMSSLVISDTLYDAYDKYATENGMGKETVAPHESGIYAFAIAPMPTDKAVIRKLVELNYDESEGLKFELQNQVMDTLGGFNDFIEIGAKIFLYIGIGFAVFSALMLMNFISVSISYKRREIGILRAVGARSSDVFKIFFCEAAIIALINYVFALAATIAATTVFNTLVRKNGINVTLLSFGIRQIVLMLVISLGVAAIASFLPVWNIAKRKPVDAIKNK